MFEDIFVLIRDVINGRRDIHNCKNQYEFIMLMAKKPPAFYKREQWVVQDVIDKLLSEHSKEELAQMCYTSIETIKKLRNGTRLPSKELWVRIALAIKVPPEFVDDFMMAAGHGLNTSYIKDAIYYYSIVNGLSCNDVYVMLDENIDESTANKFLKL